MTAKKRDHRRRTSESNHRQIHHESSTQASDRLSESSTSHNNNKNKKNLIIVIVFFIVFPAITLVVAYRNRYYYNLATDDAISNVYERQLVKASVNYQEILTEHSRVLKNGSTRNFKHPVLAYITPWNSRGYEMAKMFNSKFTHLSPVWYDLKSNGLNLILEGRHNADVGWISELRSRGDARVLPRVVLEALPMDFLKNKKQMNKAIDLIVAECKEMGYDGIVLESWSRWAAYGVLHDPDMRNAALSFIKQLGQAMHVVSSKRKNEQCLQLIYVIGPPHSEKLQEHDFSSKDLESLSDNVDGFSIMTYDFSSPQNPGPNAPLKWIHYTLELLLGPIGTNMARHKIFLGINFYGNDFMFSGGVGGGAITGRDYLALLKQHKPVFSWETTSEEHYFLYSDNNQNKHAVFYPSLMSISIRLAEAQLWGVGISIWEIGQGLDYFFDLL